MIKNQFLFAFNMFKNRQSLPLAQILRPWARAKTELLQDAEVQSSQAI